MNTVLFACIHNAGRSQMAAAWFNALADETKARAVSAGTEPGARVHPEVVEAMREVGVETAGNVPQQLTDELAAGCAVLITMGCGEACPVVPGLRRLDWPLEDPKGKPIERVREIRDEVRRRVLALLEQEQWARPPVVIAPAHADDLPQIEDLIHGARLPLEGVRDQFPSAFTVARHGGAVVGVAALERYGQAGLLRSVAVLPGHRRLGVGRRLVADRLEHAARSGLERVILLTTTAPAFFERLGFAPVPRSQVPASMAQSPEFAEACPSSAACLAWSPRG